MKIISGGQTGVDRAALDWAIQHDIPHGGWCPRGRRAEDGTIPEKYQLEETPSDEYAQRTEWNVRDSDITLIFADSLPLTGGTLLTKELAERYHKPCHVQLNEENSVLLMSFLQKHQPQTLNIAGPRASAAPDIGAWVQRVLDAIFFGR